MSNSTQEQIIIMSLKPLFEQAEAEGTWFHHNSSEVDEVWASPEHLRQEQESGRLIWAPEHWDLRSPVEYMASLHQKAGDLIAEYNEMAGRLQVPNVLLMEKQDMQPNAKVG